MKVTFPHLGNTCFAAKAVLDGLGIDNIVPPYSNKEALQIGSKYSPEEMCLPFKIMLGNYIQSIEKGADTVLLTGSCGPCRFGEYCELQMNILKNIGYNVDFVVLDNPNEIGKDEFLRRANFIGKNSKMCTKDKLKALIMGYKVINLIDFIEKMARFKVGYEINKGQCKSILNQCKKHAIECNKPEEMIKVLKYYEKEIKNIPIDKNKKPIKVSLIGEIYTLLEPFANLYIEDKLMDMGVSTEKTLTPSWWMKNTLLSPFKINSMNIKKASKNYLPLYIGGHGRECIGEAVLSYKKGFNGAIQIFPVGCMPEIVSKSILPTISKDKKFPIMTLIVDEMTGEAGFDTRLEAFVDMLERRKLKNVLYGS